MTRQGQFLKLMYRSCHCPAVCLGGMYCYAPRKRSMHGDLHAASQLALNNVFCLVCCTVGGVDDNGLQLEE